MAWRTIGRAERLFHQAAIKMIQMQGGVFGAVSTSPHFIATMHRLVPS